MADYSPTVIAGNYAFAKTCAHCGERPAVRFDQEVRDATATEASQLARSGQPRLVTGTTTLYLRRGQVRVSAWLPVCAECVDRAVPDPDPPAPQKRWCSGCGEPLTTDRERCDECRVEAITPAIRSRVIAWAKQRLATGAIARKAGIGLTSVRQIRAEAGLASQPVDGARLVSRRRRTRRAG